MINKSRNTYVLFPDNYIEHIFANLDHYIVRYNMEMQRTYVSSKWLKAVGRAREDVLGVPIDTIPNVSSSVSVRYLNTVKQVLSTGSQNQLDLAWKNAKGEGAISRYVLSPELDGSGNITGVLSIGFDLPSSSGPLPVCSNQEPPASSPACADLIQTIEQYLSENCDKHIHLKDLSALSGLSARTIQELFLKIRGYSPSQFLRECRLLKAHKILQESHSGASIVAVALDCGFATHAHFSDSYRRRFGVTPLETLKKQLR